MTNNEFKALIEAKTVEQLKSLIATGECLEPEFRTEQSDKRLQMAKDELVSRARTAPVRPAYGSYIAYLVNCMEVNNGLMECADDFYGKAMAQWSLCVIRLDNMGVTLPNLNLANKWWTGADVMETSHALAVVRTFEDHKEMEGL